MWGVDIAFRYFDNCGPNGELSEKAFGAFAGTVFTAFRRPKGQILFTFHIDKMIINNISVSFVTTQSPKHCRKGSKLETFEYRTYEKPDLCFVAYLKNYLSSRNNSTDHKQLIITYGKSYKPASTDSICRWVKELFTESKIGNFIPHSCHAASASKAMTINISIERIIGKGC